MNSWKPTKFIRHLETISTSTEVAIVLTDAGKAYIKVMGNNEGPHVLARELVCTQLAGWFDLPILDWSILKLQSSDTFDLDKGRMAIPGPSFATRLIEAKPWDGSDKILKRLMNSEAITRLVIFNTWIKNDDRYPPVDDAGAVKSDWKLNLDNVLVTREDAPKGKFRLIAMDFGRGLRREKVSDLSVKLANQDSIRNVLIYGLFPQFRKFVTEELVDISIDKLRSIESNIVEIFVDSIPNEWEVSEKIRVAIVEFICSRADFLADTIKARLSPLCFPQCDLPYTEVNGKREKNDESS